MIPTNDGSVCVCASATPHWIGRGGPEVIADVIGSTFPDLVTQARRRRGDAGYWKDPLSVHGFTDALRDAPSSWRAPSSMCSPTALRGCQRRRDELSSELFDVVDAIAGHRWTDGEIPQTPRAAERGVADEVGVLAPLPTIAPGTRVGGP